MCLVGRMLFLFDRESIPKGARVFLRLSGVGGGSLGGVWGDGDEQDANIEHQWHESRHSRHVRVLILFILLLIFGWTKRLSSPRLLTAGWRLARLVYMMRRGKNQVRTPPQIFLVLF